MAEVKAAGSEENSGCTWKRVWMGRAGGAVQGGAGIGVKGGDDGQGAGAQAEGIPLTRRLISSQISPLSK